MIDGELIATNYSRNLNSVIDERRNCVLVVDTLINNAYHVSSDVAMKSDSIHYL